jgi:Ethylene-responsive protein kinase Le-CTR1
MVLNSLTPEEDNRPHKNRDDLTGFAMPDLPDFRSGEVIETGKYTGWEFNRYSSNNEVQLTKQLPSGKWEFLSLPINDFLFSLVSEPASEKPKERVLKAVPEINKVGEFSHGDNISFLSSDGISIREGKVAIERGLLLVRGKGWEREFDSPEELNNLSILAEQKSLIASEFDLFSSMGDKIYRNCFIKLLNPDTGAVTVKIPNTNKIIPFATLTELILDIRSTDVELAAEATEEYSTKNRISGNIPDGFLTTSRSKEGEAISVNRKLDPYLREQCQDADSLKKLPEVERAHQIARMVFHLNHTDHAGMRADYLQGNLQLGAIFQARSAICRHRALLFQILANEAGLDVTMVRGQYSDFGKPGGHAWNELRTSDGQLLIVDANKPHRNELYICQPSQIRGQYYDAEDEPLYGDTGLSLRQ